VVEILLDGIDSADEECMAVERAPRRLARGLVSLQAESGLICAPPSTYQVNNPKVV